MALIEEALQGWRDAERLLDELPPLHPDYEPVRLAVASFKGVYQSVSDTPGASKATLRANEATLRGAQDVVRRARDRIGPADVVSPGRARPR